MSSFYENLLVAAPAAATKIRASAAVVPWRLGDQGRIEVYWVRRSPRLAFMGGFMAFPGGGLDAKDREIPLEGGERSPSFTRPSPDLSDEQLQALGADVPPGLLACALRELFEECGLLLAAGTAADAELDEDRRALLAGERDFASLVAARGWRLDAGALRLAGRWLTPNFGPIRFDNRFFLLHWPAAEGRQPTIVPGELVDGGWIEPAAALAEWRRGTAVASPPILHLLRVLGEDGPERGMGRLLDTREVDLGSERRIELRPGIVLLPLRVPTLPPAAHTNTFLVGHGELVLIDPATPYPDEQERLLAALRALRAQGERIRAIWLTHHHPDHVGAVELCRRELGVPVHAHRLTAEALAPRGIAVDHFLEDGDRVELGGMTLRVVHTPGHTRGHLCFYDEELGSLIAGDLLSTLSTIVIDPPEGDMSAYLDSLARIIELAPVAVFPSHGPMVLDGVARLRQLREHRLEREAKVLAVWRSGKRDAAAMVAEVYDDTPPALHPLAMRQLEAHLERLRRLGEI